MNAISLRGMMRYLAERVLCTSSVVDLVRATSVGAINDEAVYSVDVGLSMAIAGDTVAASAASWKLIMSCTGLVIDD